MTKKEKIKQTNHLWIDITNKKLKKTANTHTDCEKLTPEEIKEQVNFFIKLQGWLPEDCEWELRK